MDVGLFHDEQKRSVATVEFWVNAVKARGLGDSKVGVLGGTGSSGRGLQTSPQAFVYVTASPRARVPECLLLYF